MNAPHNEAQPADPPQPLDLGQLIRVARLKGVTVWRVDDSGQLRPVMDASRSPVPAYRRPRRPRSDRTVDEAHDDVDVLEPQPLLHRDQLARHQRYLRDRARLRQPVDGRNGNHQPVAGPGHLDDERLHTSIVSPR